MGIDTWIVDIKGFDIGCMDQEQQATLEAASGNECQDPEDYGVDQFKPCKDELEKDLQSLPGYKHLKRYVEDYHNEWEWCVFGWDHYDTYYDPTDEDLDKLKTILEKHGFTVDGRIEKDRFTYLG